MELITPLGLIRNENYMSKVRKARQVNFDLPACIELEDPNRFLPNLRPVEDFPHTPLIPIAESQMNDFKERVLKRQSNKFEMSYTMDKFFSFGLMIGTISLIMYFFKQFLQRQDEMMTDFYRKKLKN